MDGLSTTQRELVALGAALGSNCVPCVERHVPEARKSGLSDRQITEAIRLADKIRQAPARKVLDTALDLVSTPGRTPGAEPGSAGQPGEADEAAATGAKRDPGCAAPSSPGSGGPCCG